MPRFSFAVMQAKLRRRTSPLLRQRFLPLASRAIFSME
jgi:hypothetical protein